jgi:ABC-2 type transport system ATP-binding protein
MTAVRVRELVRRYGNRSGGDPVLALDAVNLEIEAGEVHGLLGPNGAGKTTLCKILSTILQPSSGNATVLGDDVVLHSARVKRNIGLVLGGERGLYGRLTARQNLMFWAALYGLGRADSRRRTAELLDRVGLAERADERVDIFSRGMKQRLHLARGLVSDPPVLILDEPTVGMDPVAAHDFRSLIGDLRADDRTVLLTTHDMQEAEAICDRVTLVDRGRILLTERPAAVSTLITRYERVDASPVDEQVCSRLRLLDGVMSVVPTGSGRVRVEIAGADGVREVLACLVAAGATEIVTGRPRLEEVYLHLVGTRGMRVGS